MPLDLCQTPIVCAIQNLMTKNFFYGLKMHWKLKRKRLNSNVNQLSKKKNSR